MEDVGTDWVSMMEEVITVKVSENGQRSVWNIFQTCLGPDLLRKMGHACFTFYTKVDVEFVDFFFFFLPSKHYI